MSKYPNIKSSKFYKNINEKFKLYKIPNHNKTEKEICYPKEFQLQKPQLFVSKYINPLTQYQNLLVFHGIGSGKTCTAVQLGETWKHKRKIIFVAPASLLDNFRKELRSKCAGNTYVTEKERTILSLLEPNNKEYKRIIDKSNKEIDKYYEIYSYNKFISLIQNNKIKFNNKLLIMDEIQNVISSKGIYYKVLLETLEKVPKDLRIVLLSATPMMDYINEFPLLMNLIIKDKLPTNTAFVNQFITKEGNELVLKNENILKEHLKGYVSYFKGASKVAFPNNQIEFKKVPMSNFQYKQYQKVKQDARRLNTSEEFHLGLRMTANIAFPNNKFGIQGYQSLTNSTMKDIKNYSIKFFEMLKEIKNTNGLVFIYSNFKQYGGLKSFIKVLEFNGYLDYAKNDIGTKRFALIDGDTNMKLRETIRTIFNNYDNKDGSMIKIILGSSAIKEGVSFMRVQLCMVMESYWNFARVEQVIGRVSRYCSHKDVPNKKVRTLIFMASYSNKILIDEKLRGFMTTKYNLINQFERILKESSVDCQLNQNSHQEKLKCVKS